MDPHKKLQYGQAKLDTLSERVSVLLKRLGTVTYSAELEQEVQASLEDVRELMSLAEEFQLLASVSYFDRSVYGFNDEQLKQLDRFGQVNLQKIQKMEQDLTRGIMQKKLESERRRLSERERLLARNTAQQVMADQQANMNDFTAQVHSGVRDIKSAMLEVNENLQKGQLQSDLLENKVKDNVEDNKRANSKVRKATAALKRNKDTVFLGIAVLTTVSLVLTLVL